MPATRTSKQSAAFGGAVVTGKSRVSEHSPGRHPLPLKDLVTQNVPDASHTTFAAALSPESIEHAKTLITADVLPDTAKTFVRFVELCERKERETGQPCTITASY